jgi:hypothetical protein
MSLNFVGYVRTYVGGNNKRSKAVPIKMDLAGAKKAKAAVDSRK